MVFIGFINFIHFSKNSGRIVISLQIQFKNVKKQRFHCVGSFSRNKINQNGKDFGP